MNEEGVEAGGEAGAGRKKLIAGIVVAVIVVAGIFLGLKMSQSNDNMGITPPSPIIKLAIIDGEYVWNITDFWPGNPYPDIDWYNLNNYAFLVTDTQYGYYYHTHPNANNSNTSNIISGMVSEFINSSGDIEYFDNDFDHNLSIGDSLVFRGDLAENIYIINENLSHTSDELWLNLFYTNGIENGLGKDTLYIFSRPFYELEYGRR